MHISIQKYWIKKHHISHSSSTLNIYLHFFDKFVKTLCQYGCKTKFL